jgi:hypothetical protein
MPKITYQDFNQLECNDLVINNKIKNKNVKINDGNNYLEIQDNQGKKLFWVNDTGCNIKSIDKAVELEHILDFPTLKDGVLYYNWETLEFQKDISLNNLSVINSSVENLQVDNLEIKNLKLPDALLDKILNINNINIKSLTNEILNTNELSSVNINSDVLKTKVIGSEEIETNTISSKMLLTDVVKSKNILVEEGKINSFEAEEAGIAQLECSSIMAHNMNILETANIKVLNNEVGNIGELQVNNCDIQILKVNKIIKSVTERGSIEKPLILNMVDNGLLDCNNDENNIKIYNKINDKTPENKFELLNLPDGDYKVITKCHNQFINIIYNICIVDNKKYLYAKFKELPNKLVFEILLERI